MLDGVKVVIPEEWGRRCTCNVFSKAQTKINNFRGLDKTSSDPLTVPECLMTSLCKGDIVAASNSFRLSGNVPLV